MEHYLGEKLKKLRESRNWTQAELAKRLNKSVSTVSGYESDAHAIPLNVLPLSGLTKEQCDLLRRIQQEYLVPSQRGKNFSEKQMKIIHDIIKSFG